MPGFGNGGNGAPHAKPGANVPEGGNHVQADGSARWFKFQQMYCISSWGPNRRGCFYQEDLGPELEPLKPSIAAVAR